MATVRLWRAGAIVLYDWLRETDLNSLPMAQCDYAVEHATVAEIEGAQTAVGI